MFFLLIDLCFSKILLQPHEERSFLNWMRSNNAFYTGDEYHFRLGIFLSNKRFVEDFNKDSTHLSKVSLGKFACYTRAEYQALLGVIPQVSQNKPNTKVNLIQNNDDPDSLDWRTKGAVNTVKDQGSCGSCWAFSAIAAEEGAYFVSSGKLYRLSEQNLVDCTTTCYGCQGGLPELGLGQALNSQNRKFALESDYPYVGYQQSCLFDQSKAVADISAITMYREEKYIQPNLIKWGPTSVCIDASGASFMLYDGGIYKGSDCRTAQNHAVCVVGYGTEGENPYWIVRNSWGPSWGEAGYIRMLRNVNVCNIQGTITGIEI
ncbi:hypothetical protein M9Y10_007655 [Tritrichomonas musculus]|uniref:Uncharacterized protein n=1 Tax=Tritrichomonas musculus TaxID=1915356 RepID=A0ABR2J213_9EUKA